MGVMPKETINPDNGRFEVQVGWRNESDVQVGVEAIDGYTLVSILYGDREALELIGQRVYSECVQIEGGLHDSDQTMHLGRAILNIIEASQSSPGSASYTGVWASLSRAGINRLVRTLRRARDAAYGRDE